MKLLSLGSCFSSEIGERLDSAGCDICANPFGVLYNPASIASSLRLLASDYEFSEKDIVLRDPYYCSRKGSIPTAEDMKGHRSIAPCIGGYVSFYHHGSFTRPSKEEFLSNANEQLLKARGHFRNSEIIIVTFGTAWVFRHLERCIIVSNCHKHPAAKFRREFLSIDEIYALWAPLIQELGSTCDGKQRQWIFTVSPIRHLKDGLHGNQLSKSTLLMAIDRLQHEFGCITYFPSYEIMLDELRDYSWYEEDKMHPSQKAIDYIFDIFKKEINYKLSFTNWHESAKTKHNEKIFC